MKKKIIIGIVAILVLTVGYTYDNLTKEYDYTSMYQTKELNKSEYDFWGFMKEATTWPANTPQEVSIEIDYLRKTVSVDIEGATSPIVRKYINRKKMGKGEVFFSYDGPFCALNGDRVLWKATLANNSVVYTILDK